MAYDSLAKMRYTDMERRLLYQAKTKLLESSDEIVDAIMRGVRRDNPDPQLCKLAASYSLGTPPKQRNTLDIPELVGVSPLKKMKIIGDLVSTGRLTVEEGKTLSQMISVEIESSQLQVISVFLQRLQTEDIKTVSKEMLPMLRQLEGISEVPAESNIRALTPEIEELLK